MINLKELRIGNKILYKGYDIDPSGNRVGDPDGDFEVDLDLDVLVSITKSLSVYEPIPLTPEWLERMGFKDGWLEFNNGCQLTVHLTDGTATASGWDSATSGQSVEVPCKYAHQLQNLYFALTGEELTI